MGRDPTTAAQNVLRERAYEVGYTRPDMAAALRSIIEDLGAGGGTGAANFDRLLEKMDRVVEMQKEAAEAQLHAAQGGAALAPVAEDR